MSTELLYYFKYTVKLPNGKVIKDGTLAHSTWHAVDKAILKYGGQQSDRTKYYAKKNINLQVR